MPYSSSVSGLGYVWISHKHQPVIHGASDTEVTATYLLKTETDSLPAFAIAGEVKLPTAHNRGIGTGRVDYAVYLVASKHIGSMDVHANIAYTFVGKPPGTSVQNTTSFALAAELPLSPTTDFFTEVTPLGYVQRNARTQTGVAASHDVWSPVTERPPAPILQPSAVSQLDSTQRDKTRRFASVKMVGLVRFELSQSPMIHRTYQRDAQGGRRATLKNAHKILG